MSVLFINIGLHIYNAWFIDLQAQGRYLFPSVIALCLCVSWSKKIMGSPVMQVLLCATGVLSLYSYLYALRQILSI